ncbi:hypothetical protein LCGC14_1767670 [marine sediment metagenome]|uniref:Uncharacterized protein n=1 Tax=marine sediment metagenome TaxID=412755 RepID=A0A0F9JYX0_9ZZZZ
MSVIENQEDLEEKIKVRAYYLSEENLSFNDLCWRLAEKLIQVQRKGRIDIDEIKKKAEEIYKQYTKYDELCWRIAELAIVGKVDEKKDLFSQKETKPQEVKEVFEAKNKFLEDQASQFKEQEEKLSESKLPEIRVETKPQEVKEDFEAKNKFLEEQASQFKEQEEKLSESKTPEIKLEGLLSKERLSCPKCGAVGHIIKSVDDKSKVLSYIGSRPIYQKKKICRNCGQEF